MCYVWDYPREKKVTGEVPFTILHIVYKNEQEGLHENIVASEKGCLRGEKKVRTKCESQWLYCPKTWILLEYIIAKLCLSIEL